MTTTDLRSELAEVTAAAGWDRRIDDRVDIYLRGQTRVRVIWQGNDAISGGSRFQDDNLETYSRDLNTVKGWLSR
jgi:Lon protease-like protein